MSKATRRRIGLSIGQISGNKCLEDEITLSWMVLINKRVRTRSTRLIQTCAVQQSLYMVSDRLAIPKVVSLNSSDLH